MKLFCPLFLVGGLMLAPIVPASDPGTYRLVARYSLGEQHRYSIVTAIAGMVADNRAVGLQFALRYKVLQTLANSTKVRLTYDAETTPLAFKPSTIVLDKYNRPAKGSRSAQVFVILPDHPVKIGEKWNGAYSLILGDSSGALLDVTYKLDGVKKVGTRNIADISTSLRGVAPGEGTVLVDLKDGSVLSSVMNVRIKDKDKKSYPVQILLKRQS